LTAYVEVPAKGGDGVIVAEGGRFGGFSLFVKGGKLIYENNTLGRLRDRIVADAALPAGHVIVMFEFVPDGKPTGPPSLQNRRFQSGQGRLLVDGKQVGTGHFAQFGGFADAINETLDVGLDSGSPVSRDYLAPFPYSGVVTRVTIDLL
jgi:arylsulfatase